MKKVIALLFVFLYIVPVVGVNISMHYCGGELTSVSQPWMEVQKCLCGNKAMKKSCCEDKLQTIKLDTDHQKTTFSNVVFEVQQATIPVVVSQSYVPTLFDRIVVIDTSEYPPPILYEKAVYIRHCVYLI
jgi:hypothetical protein